MKVIGVGLNKTGTKTLRHCLQQWGFRHRTYDVQAFENYRAGRIDELLTEMEGWESFEDWPWPLMYREIDKRFPDAKFVLTTRLTADQWYRSLCKMAVRMGPLRDFEKHIYGYDMPQGRRREHLEYYERHNREVEAYFDDRPDKLLKICWANGEQEGIRLAEFLNQPKLEASPPNLNQSLPVYAGDNLALAHANRIVFQTKWKTIRTFRRLKRDLLRKITPPTN